MKTLTALVLVAAAALLGACNKTAGDNASGTASNPNRPASASK
jgi:hypothetical protein